MLAVWLIGGALAFAGALAYAELASLRPRAGGEYVYLREAYGPLAGFLTGWTSFVAGFSGAIAVSSVVFAVYLWRFVPAAGSHDALFSIPIIPGLLTLTVSAQSNRAILFIFAMSWVHLRGVGPGRIVGDILAGLKVSAFVLFVAIGFAVGHGDATHLSHSAPVPVTSW